MTQLDINISLPLNRNLAGIWPNYKCITNQLRHTRTKREFTIVCHSGQVDFLSEVLLELIEKKMNNRDFVVNTLTDTEAKAIYI